MNANPRLALALLPLAGFVLAPWQAVAGTAAAVALAAILRALLGVGARLVLPPPAPRRPGAGDRP